MRVRTYRRSRYCASCASSQPWTQGLVPEDADAFVKRIHMLRDRYEDTYLPARERRVSQEEQQAAEDEEFDHLINTTPLYASRLKGYIHSK